MKSASQGWNVSCG